MGRKLILIRQVYTTRDRKLDRHHITVKSQRTKHPPALRHTVNLLWNINQWCVAGSGVIVSRDRLCHLLLSDDLKCSVIGHTLWHTSVAGVWSRSFGGGGEVWQFRTVKAKWVKVRVQCAKVKVQGFSNKVCTNKGLLHWNTFMNSFY